MENREGFLEAAKKGNVYVEFTNIYTGKTKTMLCTLRNVQIEQRADNDNFVVFSLDKNNYRSFRVDTVTKWYACNGQNSS